MTDTSWKLGPNELRALAAESLAMVGISRGQAQELADRLDERAELYVALQNLLGTCEIASVLPESIGKTWVPAMDAPELEHARAALAKVRGEV